MLGKRHSKEYFSDVLDDLKRSWIRLWEIMMKIVTVKN